MKQNGAGKPRRKNPMAVLLLSLQTILFAKTYSCEINDRYC
jgi:hypothetical protein